MSQKAKALEAYTEIADNYATYTQWAVLRTVKQELFPTDEPVPANFDIEEVVSEHVNNLIKSVQWRFSKHDYPLFVRACPLNPRPGVLESSRADTEEDVITIARRIITTMLSPDPSTEPMYESGLIDPQGTVIVQPFINANASAVVAPNNYILMGRDNDGITAGKDGLRVAIPLGNDYNVNKDFERLDLDPANIEIEFVSQRNDTNIESALRNSNIIVTQKTAMVQLRGSEGHRPIAPAPKGVSINGTFHGADRITINHIHLVSDNTDEQLDLMEQALREGMPEGSVVLHPNGSHLSHHAGQCFKYGVPYIASDQPQVGEQWTQAALGWVVLDNEGTYEPQAYDPLDFTHAFIEGFDIGFSNYARQHGWLSNHFHQFIGGPIGDAEQTAKFAGAYTAWLINATLSVGFGELRHVYSAARDSTATVMATAYALYGKEAWKKASGMIKMTSERQHYYTVIENNPITLQSAVEMFAFLEACYGLHWNSGYGGAKYRLSCFNGRSLTEAVIKFFADPSDKNFKHMLSTANLVEHNVHNNGFFFNKFISKTALDWGTDPSSVSVRPTEFFSVYYAADHIMNAYPRQLNDVTHILDLYKTISIKALKQTPLANMNNELGHVAKYLPSHFLHPQGKYSLVGQASFLLCGIHNCEQCDTHKQHYGGVQTLDLSDKYEAPFPTTADADVTAMYKSLSKMEMDNVVINTLVALMKQYTAPTSAQKYLALIVSKMDTEQLQYFSKLHNAGDE